MQKFTAYSLIGVSVIASLASLLTLDPYLIIFSALISLSLFFLYNLWDILEGLIIKKSGITQVIGGYELEGDRISAVVKQGKNYLATSAAVLRDLPSKEIDREGIERIISSSNAPFRFVVQVAKLNTGKIFDELRTKRRMKEIKLSRTTATSWSDTSPTRVIERELELVENEIKAIGNGAVPLKTSIYLMSFAEADSRFSAQERAFHQVKALAGEFSAVLGATFEVLSGSELVGILLSEFTYGVR